MAASLPEYPWVRSPLISVAPMRLITLAKLASAVSNAGGLGFIGAGSDASTLASELEQAKSLLTVEGRDGLLPIGVGFILWAGDKLLNEALPALEANKPSAVWLFAPDDRQQYEQWTTAVRKASPATQIWIQIGTVAEARHVVLSCKPDVLVVQGTDAGGHGLQQGASIVTLLPEVHDTLQTLEGAAPRLIGAGGIMDGRGVAAALTLGAVGVSLGTRYLASPEANIARGYQDAVLRAADGGVTTARSKLYDTLRGTTDWPNEYGGRGVLNSSWTDSASGMSFEENKRRYDEALGEGDAGWGSSAAAGRLTTYAGTGVGLVSTIVDAASLTADLRRETIELLQARARQFVA